ncbi:MAG: aminotransferase [Clostridia bacterium]|jgi:aspartate/methionine/tyrosine aminotransferase|nr:aminotransferase [Clostridia bacterium]
MITGLSRNELKGLLEELKSTYEVYKSKGLKLDMSRGKPGSDQLDISKDLLTILNESSDCIDSTGFDCRNYGLLDGISEAKKIFADLFGVSAEETIVGGNSSLNMMYDTITRAMLFGVFGSDKPWSKYDKIKFICPVPGYDRHFTICESLNIEMINVDMLQDGPDMATVEKLVAQDDTIKGIWCVPRYSNPEGKTYSDRVVKRLANLKPAAKDFRIFWDNAYALHNFDNDNEVLLNLIEQAKLTGNADMVFMFMSTSKVSFPGSGVAAMAASINNINLIKKQMFAQSIGPDKLNQLRHVRYYKNADGVRAYMKKHADIVKPHFEAVLSTLKKNLSNEGIADWVEPKGGYFVSLNVMKGCAKRTVALLKEAGVVMTPAGATFPYGKDPNDSNIRIAPTYPPVLELLTAMELLCICVKIAAIEKLLNS